MKKEVRVKWEDVWMKKGKNKVEEWVRGGIEVRWKDVPGGRGVGVRWEDV